MIEFKLPSLGSDMDSGTLLEWRVAPGQSVKQGDVLAVVDTSKAAVDVEVWHEGRVQRLITQVGETIPVGSVMALLLSPGEAPPAGDDLPAAAPAVARSPPPADLPSQQPSAAGMAAAPTSPPSRPLITPAARRRAAVLGLSIEQLAGSGADGAVTLADVERAAAGRVPGGAATAEPAAAPAPGGPPGPGDRAAAMRRAIAAAMARSKREIPHYYLSDTVPMATALDWLRARNAARPVTQRLLPAVLLIKAVALAAREVPELNGWFDGGLFRPAAAVHVGVAISLRQGGLVAPALHDVAAQPLDALMPALGDLVRRARAGSLRSSEMSDPTITVTNLGDQGVDAVFGVIYPPQVALVGFGRIAERALVEAGRLVVGPAVTASLAADHRASDGHRGALFLARLRELLQQPAQLDAAADAARSPK